MLTFVIYSLIMVLHWIFCTVLYYTPLYCTRTVLYCLVHCLVLQVTARMTGPAVHSFQQPQPLGPAAGTAMGASTSSTEGQVSAALGTKWAHAVNVRLVLERRGTGRVITVSAVRLMPLAACVAAPLVSFQQKLLACPHSKHTQDRQQQQQQ
jgi:hypothetical protein